MRRPTTPPVHAQACTCRRCSPAALATGRLDLAIKVATRVLVLIAVVAAIPFIVAHALASAKGNHR